MVGVEYILLHVQDPILYVIRKQHRHSPTEATPMADYYIIAGTIYQAPDLASVFNSRLVNHFFFIHAFYDDFSLRFNQNCSFVVIDRSSFARCIRRGQLIFTLPSK